LRPSDTSVEITSEIVQEAAHETCLNCDQPAQLGSVVCPLHSGQEKPVHSNGRIFLSSMIVTLIVGAIIFGCFMGVRLLQR